MEIDRTARAIARHEEAIVRARSLVPAGDGGAAPAWTDGADRTFMRRRQVSGVHLNHTGEGRRSTARRPWNKTVAPAKTGGAVNASDRSG